ncbi:hypothetical protein [uncultured Polaribacter sp.]|uniref:acyltransferase n=1 Tax=uncultured Polaribacter sp. TaxID=174711 RepID=UPI002604A4A4|nr:hypothetical protein [uncultured Polaribacter sp.]
MKSIIRILVNNFYNNIVTYVPSNSFRLFILKYFFKMSIGKNVLIAPRVKIINPWNISIGDNTIINSSVFLDGRGSITIGENVDVAWFSKIITYQHDYNNPYYTAFGTKVVIKDFCCITVNSIILPGVHLAEGVVIGASSVVTKSMKNKYKICVGAPCSEIKDRNRDLRYLLSKRSLTI